MPDDPGSPKEIPHNGLKGFVVHFREVAMNHHDEVEPSRHPAHVEPEVLSQPSPHTIPGHRSANTTAHGEAQTRLRSRAALDEEAQTFPGNLFAAPQDFPKLTLPTNAFRTREAIGHL